MITDKAIPLHMGMRLWRERYQLSAERAADLLGTMPYNIERAEDGTLHPNRAKLITERLAHVYDTQRRCRCVIRYVREKHP